MKNNWIQVRRIVGVGVALLFCLASYLAGQATAPVDAVEAGHVLQPPHQKAALIKLHGEVDDMMLNSLQRRVDLARKAGCTLIVFEMDTFGGLVTSAIDISKFIKRLPDEKIATVAWVHDKAYSAGSLISVANQQIVMSREATIGLCAPIAKNRLLPAAERAKAVTFLFEEFDDSARKNGYKPVLLRAMVDPDIEIHEMHDEKGNVDFVDTPGKTALLAEEIVLPDGTRRHPWRFVQTFDPLLTVGPDAALAMKLSRARVDNEEQLRAALNIQGNLLALDFSWAEIATVWLTQWWVRGMLFLAMLVLAYIEFSHPGVSLPGIGALICLILLIGAPFLTGLAQVWEIAFIVLGLAIIVLDLVIFGGIGLLAIPGFVLMLVGIIASFVPAEPGGGFIPTMQSSWDALTWGTTAIATALVAAIVIFFFMSKYLRLTPGFRRIQLAPAGGAPAMATQVIDAAERSATDAAFPGALGRAASDLRPAGKARFGEYLLDVVTRGDFVESGAEVEVVEIAGSRIVVKPRRVG